jgi:hypothetical protein
LKRLFKEREEDKINIEIMNEVYPVESMKKYYLFGFANALSYLTDTANNYINKDYGDKLDAHDLKLLINELVSADPYLRDTYLRLRKDGIKTKLEQKTEEK